VTKRSFVNNQMKQNMKVKGNIGRKCLIGKAGALLLTRRSGTLRRAGSKGMEK